MKGGKMKDKRIVVSGAANGIGAAIFCQLLRQGAFPIGIDIEPFEGSELKKKIGSSWVNFNFFENDASNMTTMKEIFRDIKNLDGLVNNAAILSGDDLYGGRSIKSWNKVMKANAQTAFVLTELCYPLMKNDGSIVNIGSIINSMTRPNAVLYTGSKSLLWGLTLGYSVELAEKNIRVNMVSPGNVNTERNKAQYEKVPELIKGFETRTPLRRSVEPDEIANMVLFLLSDKSKAITGQEIIIDCGYTKALWDPNWTNK